MLPRIDIIKFEDFFFIRVSHLATIKDEFLLTSQEIGNKIWELEGRPSEDITRKPVVTVAES